MRRRAVRDGLTVRAIAGTHTVLLGFDLADFDAAIAAGVLGFAVRRTDHSEDEQYWLRGMKVFPSVVPTPARGATYSLRAHPVQGFQWGDYSAKPGHRYTYRVATILGPVDQPTIGSSVDVTVRTEVEDDGLHGVWFNRGVAGSQAWERKFQAPSIELADPGSEAWAWLSRGLGEAFAATCARATDAGWALRGAFYEFTWPAGLAAFAAAAGRGADVQLVVHGRDRDPEGDPDDDDRTAANNRAAVAAAGIDALVTWRVAPNKSALQHNKFVVVLRNGQPEMVWTGSANLTQGGIYGHSNVGHLIHDPAVAAAFLAYWNELRAERTTQQLRDWIETTNPVAQPPTGVVFSPRATGSTLLADYAGRFGAATHSAHITGAFGINEVFRDVLATPRSYLRNVLLERRPAAEAAIPDGDRNVRTVWGAHLRGPLEQFAEEHLTGFNGHVAYIHLKTILIDPLTATPTVITGSANYSIASTTSNEENTIVIEPRAGQGAAFRRAPVRRVADIYLTEYHRLFTHHVFRAFGQPPQPGAATTGGRGLVEDSSWLLPHRDVEWRRLQRKLFAGT